MKIRFLSLEDVLTLHEGTIRREGGLDGLREPALLESAVMMPQQRFGGQYLHEGLPAMAAAYLFHLTQNHAFRDGNKRVGALAALVFLTANDCIELPGPEELETMTLRVAASQCTKTELTAWFQETIG